MTALRVLVAGAGVAGLETVLALRHVAGERTTIELVAPGPDYVQRPASVATPFDGPAAPRMPVERLAVPVVHGTLAEVDPGRHAVVTTEGRRLAYDRLVVAVGARAEQALEGALHFYGPRSAGLVQRALRDAPAEPGRPVAFVVPPGTTWPLPVYELALAAAAAGRQDVCLITPEARPLELFGPTASDAIARLLVRAGIEVRVATGATGVFDDALLLEPGGLTSVAAVITVPVLRGRRIRGLPHDQRGFIPVDEHGRVHGIEDVFAAGDATDGPVKQGGLAAQQADAVAAAIAAEAGGPPAEAPAPILRALLRTGGADLHLRTPIERPQDAVVSTAPLWRPEGKVAARHLAGVLAGRPGELLEDLPTHHPSGPVAA